MFSVQTQVGLIPEQVLLTTALYHYSSYSQKCKLKHNIGKRTWFHSTRRYEGNEKGYPCTFLGQTIWQYIPTEAIKAHFP